MEIQQAPGFRGAFRTLPGTPVVGLDKDGKPVAIGLHLSADRDQRATAINKFAAALPTSSANSGGIIDVLSSFEDVKFALHPGRAGNHETRDGFLALVMDTGDVATAAGEGDLTTLGIASFKFTLDGIDLADKAGLLGQYPAVTLGIQVLKLAVSGVELVRTKSKPAAG